MEIQPNIRKNDDGWILGTLNIECRINLMLFSNLFMDVRNRKKSQEPLLRK